MGSCNRRHETDLQEVSSNDRLQSLMFSAQFAALPDHHYSLASSSGRHYHIRMELRTRSKDDSSRKDGDR